MKPAIELVKEMLEGPVDFIGMGYQREERRRCANLLQAWLREAEIWVSNNEYQAKTFADQLKGEGQLEAPDVRRDLLGTTRQKDV